MTANCSHCGAPLELPAVVPKRSFECSYCHNQTLLSDKVWQAVKPKTQVHQQVRVPAFDPNAAMAVRAAGKMAKGIGITVALITLGSIALGVFLPIYLQNRAQKQVARQMSQSLRQVVLTNSSGAPVPITIGKLPRPTKNVKLTITSTPTGATVFINGRELGTTPYAVERQESPDTLVVKLVAEGYQPKIQKVVADQDRKVAIELTKEPADKAPER